MSKPEERVLVCALASDPDCVVKGSTMGHRCAQCHAEVMVSPSGQRMMRNHPGMAILCTPCAMAKLPEFDAVEAAPGAIEELIEDVISRRTRHARN